MAAQIRIQRRARQRLQREMDRPAARIAKSTGRCQARLSIREQCAANGHLCGRRWRWRSAGAALGPSVCRGMALHVDPNLG